MTLIGATLLGAGLSALGGIVSNVITGAFNSGQARKNREFQEEQAEITRDFNSEEAEKNRNFQEEMRDTSLVSSVNQARELGISPSLVLGQGSTALGGSQASASSVSGSQASAKFDNVLANSVNGLINTLNEKQRLNTMEEMQERQLEMQERQLETKLELAKMNNSVNSNKKFNERNYKKGELDKLFTPIEDVKI